MRFSEVTAIGRSLPPPTPPATDSGVPNAICTSPVMTPTAAGAPPR